VVAAHLDAAGFDTRLLAYVESGRGLEAAVEIGRATGRMAALLFGPPTSPPTSAPRCPGSPCCGALPRRPGRRGVRPGRAGRAVLPDRPTGRARSRVPAHRRARLRGKARHPPGQVPTIVAAYTPDAAAVARAREVLAAHDSAGGDPTKIAGTMVDEPIYRAARRVLALAGALR